MKLSITRKSRILESSRARFALFTLPADNALGHFRYSAVWRRECPGFDKRLIKGMDCKKFQIVDERLAHKGNPVRYLVDDHSGQNKPIFLSPYLPEPSRDKPAWAYARKKIAEPAAQGNSKSKTVVERVTLQLQTWSRISVRFFHIPRCAYLRN
jgi:hypothetical protein